MKKLILLLATIAICATVTTSCKIEHKKKHVKIHAYKDVNDIANVLDDVFFYVITEGDINYYTTSTTPLNSFSNVQWTMTNKPLANLQEKEIQELETQELPDNMQEAIADNPESFEGTSLDASDSAGDSGDGGGDSGGDGGGGDGGGGGGGD